jgi:hypothetical protein
MFKTDGSKTDKKAFSKEKSTIQDARAIIQHLLMVKVIP